MGIKAVKIGEFVVLKNGFVTCYKRDFEVKTGKKNDFAHLD